MLINTMRGVCVNRCQYLSPNSIFLEYVSLKKSYHKDNMNRVKVQENYCLDRDCKIVKFSSPQDLISKLIIIHKPEDVREAVEQIYQRSFAYPVIGLDCEWTPVRRKNQKPDVALLQIATRDGYCVLFRTCFMKKIPSVLLKLLADRNILKVGVGIYHDGEFLRDKYPELRVNSRFDLRRFSRCCNVFSKTESLAELTKALLSIELDKKNVLKYKWEKELDEDMVQYAALDAVAGVLIFDKLLPLFHEQASDEPFQSKKLLELIDEYFLDPGSPCSVYLDKKF